MPKKEIGSIRKGVKGGLKASFPFRELFRAFNSNKNRYKYLYITVFIILLFFVSARCGPGDILGELKRLFPGMIIPYFS